MKDEANGMNMLGFMDKRNQLKSTHSLFALWECYMWTVSYFIDAKMNERIPFPISHSIRFVSMKNKI